MFNIFFYWFIVNYFIGINNSHVRIVCNFTINWHNNRCCFTCLGPK